MMILADDLTAAVDELASADCPLMVHVSLRSLGTPIAGGADTLLDALLTRGRTVLVPAFTEPQFGLPAPAALRPARNGVDYGKFPAEPQLPEGTAYTSGCGLINTGLGVFPATLIKRGGAVRGDHPLNSFAAFGPQAEELIAAQSPADVYGPIRELAAREGRILLIGVGLNRMTAIHLAEQQSGRRSVPALGQGRRRPGLHVRGRILLRRVPAVGVGPASVCTSRGRWRLVVAGLSLEASSRRREYRDARGPGHHPLRRQRLPAMPGLNRRGTPRDNPWGSVFRTRRHLCRRPALARLLPPAQMNRRSSAGDVAPAD